MSSFVKQLLAVALKDSDSGSEEFGGSSASTDANNQVEAGKIP